MKTEFQGHAGAESMLPEFVMSAKPIFTTLMGGDVIAALDPARSQFVTRADYDAMFAKPEPKSITIYYIYYNN